MIDFKKLRDRYENDPEFYAATDCIYHLLLSATLTPDEVRDAVWLAQYKVLSELSYQRLVVNPTTEEAIK